MGPSVIELQAKTKRTDKHDATLTQYGLCDEGSSVDLYK